MRRLATAAYKFISARPNRSAASWRYRHGERSAALEIRNPGLHQQCNRIGPWHPLSGDAAGCGASHGQESARAPRSLAAIASATARSQVERLDPQDLDAREQRSPQHRLLLGEQAPRRFGVAAIERGLHAGQPRAVMLTVEALLRPSPDALDASHAPLRQDRLPPATRSCSGCTARWRCTSFPLLRASASSAGTRRDTSPSSPWYMRAQITRFCAMFTSHVTPTHWSRRIASACSDNVEAFFHSPAVIAMMPSARMRQRDGVRVSDARRQCLRLLDESLAQCSACRIRASGRRLDRHRRGQYDMAPRHRAP